MQETMMSTNSKTAKALLLAGTAGLSCAVLLAAATLLVSPRQAAANPSIAQKTGQPCGKCHTAPPALNSYGKSYKSKAK